MNEYTFTSNNNYTCQNCATAVFPFYSLSDKELMEEFFSGFEINASLLNEIFTESGQLTNCDVDFNDDEEISDNMIKEVKRSLCFCKRCKCIFRKPRRKYKQ